MEVRPGFLDGGNLRFQHMSKHGSTVLRVLCAAVSWWSLAGAQPPAPADPFAPLATSDSGRLFLPAIEATAVSAEKPATVLTRSYTHVLATQDLESYVAANFGSGDTSLSLETPAQASAEEAAVGRGAQVVCRGRAAGDSAPPLVEYLFLLSQQARLLVIGVNFVNCSRIASLSDSSGLGIRLSNLVAAWQPFYAGNSSTLVLSNVSIVESQIEHSAAVSNLLLRGVQDGALALVRISGFARLNATRLTFNATGLKGSVPPDRASPITSSIQAEFYKLRGSNLHMQDSSVAFVVDSVFTRGRAEVGGAVYLEGGASRFSCVGCMFSQNSAVFFGGSMLISEDTEVFLRDTAFVNGSAYQGGHLRMQGYSVLVGESLVVADGSAYEGGAIFINGSSALNLKNISAENNVASYLGGFLLGYNYPEINISDSFLMNSRCSYGCFFYLEDEASLSLLRSSCIGGVATMGAAAMHLIASTTVQIINSTIAEGVSLGITAAGGILLREQSSLFADGLFCVSNRALFGGTGGTGGGGCIRAYEEAKLNIFRSRLAKNTAVIGGAVILRQSTELLLVDSVCEDNMCDDSFYSSSYGYGACIALMESTNLTIINSIIQRNRVFTTKTITVNQGGAIFGYSTSHDLRMTVRMLNTTVRDNYAYDGGALFFMPVKGIGTTLVLANVSFSGNTAGRISSDIYFVATSGNDVRISDCTFFSSASSGSINVHISGASASGNDMAIVERCLFRNLSAPITRTLKYPVVRFAVSSTTKGSRIRISDCLFQDVVLNEAILDLRTSGSSSMSALLENITFQNVSSLEAITNLDAKGNATLRRLTMIDVGSVDALIKISEELDVQLDDVLLSGAFSIRTPNAPTVSAVLNSGRGLFSATAIRVRNSSYRAFLIADHAESNSQFKNVSLTGIRASCATLICVVSATSISAVDLTSMGDNYCSERANTVTVSAGDSVCGLVNIQDTSAHVTIQNVRFSPTETALLVVAEVGKDGDLRIDNITVKSLDSTSLPVTLGIARITLKSSGANVAISNVTANNLTLPYPETALFLIQSYGDAIRANISVIGLVVNSLQGRGGGIFLLNQLGYSQLQSRTPVTSLKWVSFRAATMLFLNLTSGYGGALLWVTGDSWNVSLSDVRLFNVTASDSHAKGAAIVASGGAYVLIRNSLIDSSIAASGGFAALADGARLAVINSTIRGCLASGSLPAGVYTSARTLAASLAAARSPSLKARELASSSSSATNSTAVCSTILANLLDARSQAAVLGLISRDTSRTIAGEGGLGAVVYLDATASFLTQDSVLVGNVAALRGAIASLPSDFPVINGSRDGRVLSVAEFAASASLRGAFWIRNVSSLGNAALKGSLLYLSNPEQYSRLRSDPPTASSILAGSGNCALFDQGMATAASSVAVLLPNDTAVLSGSRLPAFRVQVLDALYQEYRDPSFFSVVVRGPQTLGLTGSLNAFGLYGTAALSATDAASIYVAGKPGPYRLLVVSDDLFARDYPSSRILATFSIRIMECPAGMYVEAGTLRCLACPRGLYSSAPESPSCANPPTGFYTVDGATLISCSSGVGTASWDSARCGDVTLTVQASVGTTIPVVFLVGIAVFFILKRRAHFAEQQRLASSWLINRKEVEWVSIIGRGSFGEVWFVMALPVRIPVFFPYAIAKEKYHADMRINRRVCKYKGILVCMKKVLLAEASKQAEHGGPEASLINVDTLVRTVRLPLNTKISLAIEGMESEIEMHVSLRHPNIVLFMGAVLEPGHVYLMTEFMPLGSLDRLLLNQNIPLMFSKRAKIMVEIATGLAYLHLHSPPICHCDLKCMNVLVAEDFQVKLADFGLTTLKSDAKIILDGEMLGTIVYMGIEVLRGDFYSEASDMYSIGIIAFEVLFRSYPAYGDIPMGMSPDEFVEYITRGHRPRIPSRCPGMLSKKLNSLWSDKPEERPTITEFRDWMIEFKDDLQKKTTASGV